MMLSGINAPACALCLIVMGSSSLAPILPDREIRLSPMSFAGASPAGATPLRGSLARAPVRVTFAVLGVEFYEAGLP